MSEKGGCGTLQASALGAKCHVGSYFCFWEGNSERVLTAISSGQLCREWNWSGRGWGEHSVILAAA